MDLEQLTKTQIILLTLLVSFVTSIATGIATVSLMEKAPTDVTRVISRIIEKPIETIINNSPAAPERPAVISNDERMANAVKKVQPSLVRLYRVVGKDDHTFKGTGVIITADGMIVTDNTIIDKKEKYIAVGFDGTTFDATAPVTNGSFAYLQLKKEGATTVQVTPATIVPAAPVTLGQTVAALVGETETHIIPGIISAIPSVVAQEPARFETTISPAAVSSGTPLIDLSGTVIGMAVAPQSPVFQAISLPKTEE